MRAAASVFVVASLAILGAPFVPGTTTADTDLTFGTWSMGQQAPGSLLATHPTLLRNNKILVIGGSSFNCCYHWGMEEARIYDIASGTWGPPLPSPAPYGSDYDAFCSGHTHDHTGGVIFQGGLHSYEHNGHGIANSARYDVASGGFTQIGGARAHWYPTLVAGERHIFNFPGQPTELDPKTPGSDRIHKLAYGESAWTPTTVAFLTKSTYPRVVLLPNGKFFISSPANSDRKNYFYDPKTDAIEPAGSDLVPESGPSQTHEAASWKGSGVLLPLVATNKTYPNPRFALTNGVQNWVKNLAVGRRRRGRRWAHGRRRSRARSGATPMRRCCPPGRCSSPAACGRRTSRMRWRSSTARCTTPTRTRGR